MSSVAVESGMDNCSLIFSLKSNSVILYFLFTKIFETNKEMSMKSSGNNDLAAEDMNDNITGIDNHKHMMLSRVSQYRHMHVCVWI